VALDLSVQRPGRCRGNCSSTPLLAPSGKDLHTTESLLAIASTSGLVGCRPTFGRIHTTCFCAPRRWKHSIFVEKSDHHLYFDVLRGLLDCLFHLDILALIRPHPSAPSDLPHDHCHIQTNRPRNPVSRHSDDVQYFRIRLTIYSLVLLTGFPFFVALINLPQRFQIVNGDTPIMAGVHLLPLLCSMAFGEISSVFNTMR